ncbi:hypothetical protein Asppvi_007860 [Aspergillus pseudoviridinutans]|uniref:Uncharacterized protein n=1 Tax=Aspergillus pseudoviridinutans TaxID=1517512 RepID=A0A9P3BCZ1_9EURO|nr:uncharacterized protein Asppvi_007860 [Aspergillus pseudoviridinutans]GIJ88932.1 hypothetical protein Asppvi_007860 [Aspergillus pseudoviridinutans]
MCRRDLASNVTVTTTRGCKDLSLSPPRTFCRLSRPDVRSALFCTVPGHSQREWQRPRRESFEQLRRYTRHMVAQHPWRHPQYSIIAVGRYVEFLTIGTQGNSADDSDDETLDDSMLAIKQLASLQEAAETINAEDMPTYQKYT